VLCYSALFLLYIILNKQNIHIESINKKSNFALFYNNKQHLHIRQSFIDRAFYYSRTPGTCIYQWRVNFLLHVETESKSPTLTHVIPSHGGVVGLTVIKDTLYVLRSPSREEIQVYETATWTQQRTVRVAGLVNDPWSWYCKTLTGCSRNNRLFVCDGYSVYKVEISNDNFKHWRVDGYPSGLSVNDACNVIVTCFWGNEIREYEPEGQLVRTIQPHVPEPLHAFQLTDSVFIVSHWQSANSVSIIDERGQVTASYRSSTLTNLLKHPSHVIVVKNDLFLVADEDNNRLVVLDASLSNARELTLPIDGRLSQPRCLYFDESLGRLYVGEYGGQRVVICENISIEQ